jgi:hypothetical protein
MAIFKKDPVPNAAKSLAFNAPRAITAAATRLKINDKGEAEAFRKRRSSGAAFWQAEAWEYYDAIPEVGFAYNLASQIVSRIRLYAAVVEDASESPVPLKLSDTVQPGLAEQAERALARLDSAYGGQAGLLRDAALNLNVAGECYLVQVPALPGSDAPESWDIRSVDELTTNNQDQWVIVPRRDLIAKATRATVSSDDGIIVLPKGSFVGRIWRPHPRYSQEPDAALRRMLDLCSELMLLSRTARSTQRSRLNSGMMYLPDGLAYASSPDLDIEDDEDMPGLVAPDDDEDDFEEQFLDAMITPIKDEDSASAVAPLLVRGPAELGDKIKQFSFERSFDDSFNARAQVVLDRIMNGLDVPKDLITGFASVKYSNAQQIDDSLYKSHIEPMVLLIADAITQVYLRPYLKSIGAYSDAEIDRIVIWYDPSSISTRTDRAGDADSGYEKNAISSETWRRTHGFSEADAPTPNELAIRLIQSHGTFSPEVSEAVLTAIAPEIMQAARASQQAASVAPVPGNVNDILNGGEGVPTPETDPSSQAIDQAADVDGTTDATGTPGQQASQTDGADENGGAQNSTIPPTSDDATEAGQDAPPFQG